MLCALLTSNMLREGQRGEEVQSLSAGQPPGVLVPVRKEEAMRAWTVGLTFLLVVLVGYVAFGVHSIPETPVALVASPLANLAPELAAFSGTWEASQNGALPSRLVVERITPEWASLVYSRTDLSTEGAGETRERIRAKVLPGGRLRWGYPGRFTIQVGLDGTHIEGTKEQAGKVVTFTMKKVEPSATRDHGPGPVEGGTPGD